jgi:hypothetical protein
MCRMQRRLQQSCRLDRAVRPPYLRCMSLMSGEAQTGTVNRHGISGCYPCSRPSGACGLGVPKFLPSPSLRCTIRRAKIDIRTIGTGWKARLMRHFSARKSVNFRISKRGPWSGTRCHAMHLNARPDPPALPYLYTANAYRGGNAPTVLPQDGLILISIINIWFKCIHYQRPYR